MEILISSAECSRLVAGEAVSVVHEGREIILQGAALSVFDQDKLAGGERTDIYDGAGLRRTIRLSRS